MNRYKKSVILGTALLTGLAGLLTFDVFVNAGKRNLEVRYELEQRARKTREFEIAKKAKKALEKEDNREIDEVWREYISSMNLDYTLSEPWMKKRQLYVLIKQNFSKNEIGPLEKYEYLDKYNQRTKEQIGEIPSNFYLEN